MSWATIEHAQRAARKGWEALADALTNPDNDHCLSRALITVTDDKGGHKVTFRVKRWHTKFETVLAAFCQHFALDQSQMRLAFCGHAIELADTPGDLGMRDGDMVQAYTEGLGSKKRQGCN